MSEYLDVAVLAAKEVGKVHTKYFNGDFNVRAKQKYIDLVTDADFESEKVAVDIIRKHFPEHNFLAEENQYEKTDSQYLWVIDPLDGTNNFASGLPIFCVSIALAKDNEVILGVIYDVTRDELFSAQKNEGAFLNNKKIHVNNKSELSESLLVTGFYYNRGDEMITTLENIKKFFQNKILGIRRFGSAALDLCYVACGRVAGFWEFELNAWDFAAGKIIVQEAGGKVTGKHNEPIPISKTFVVASNGKIHDKILEVLR